MADPTASSGTGHGLLRIRVAGALVGGSLAALAAAISYWLSLYWWDIGFAIAQLAVVVGTALGFVAGPTAATARRPTGFALWLAVKAAVIGLAVLAAAALAISLATETALIDREAIAAFLVGLPIAIVAALVLALPVTIPIAIVAVAVAQLARKRPRLGELTGAAIVVLSVTLTAAATQASPLAAHRTTGSGPEFGEAVQLEWTVANRSRDDLILSVSAADLVSVGGWSKGLPACFTTTGRSAEAIGWFIGLERDGSYAGGEIHPAVVSASQVPGANPHVWIDVAPDGALSFIAGRGAPPAEQLIVDLCNGATSE
jgi:hypothetical protein